MFRNVQNKKLFLLVLSSTNSRIEYSKPKDQQDQNKGIAREKERERASARWKFNP